MLRDSPSLACHLLYYIFRVSNFYSPNKLCHAVLIIPVALVLHFVECRTMSNRIQSSASQQSPLSLEAILGRALKASEKFSIVIDGETLSCSAQGSGDGTIESLSEVVDGQEVKVTIKSSVGGKVAKHARSYTVKGTDLVPHIVSHLGILLPNGKPASQQTAPNGQPVPVK